MQSVCESHVFLRIAVNLSSLYRCGIPPFFFSLFLGGKRSNVIVTSFFPRMLRAEGKKRQKKEAEQQAARVSERKRLKEGAAKALAEGHPRRMLQRVLNDASRQAGRAQAALHLTHAGPSPLAARTCRVCQSRAEGAALTSGGRVDEADAHLDIDGARGRARDDRRGREGEGGRGERKHRESVF